MSLKSREAILARVWQNPPTSKRYVIKAQKGFVPAVYDQRERQWVPDDEIERIDPDELMRLP